MKVSKKQLIIEAFQEMNCSMLEVLLDDEKTYQEARKEVFLEKLYNAFSELKENGDTRLISYEGVCNHKDCGNIGCKGYSFVGNYSKKHIDLIFEE